MVRNDLPHLAMALYRLLCALGQHGLVSVRLKCHLPLPAYILADERHSKCLTERVYPYNVTSLKSMGWSWYWPYFFSVFRRFRQENPAS